MLNMEIQLPSLRNSQLCSSFFILIFVTTCISSANISESLNTKLPYNIAHEEENYVLDLKWLIQILKVDYGQAMISRKEAFLTTLKATGKNEKQKEIDRQILKLKSTVVEILRNELEIAEKKLAEAEENFAKFRENQQKNSSPLLRELENSSGEITNLAFYREKLDERRKNSPKLSNFSETLEKTEAPKKDSSDSKPNHPKKLHAISTSTPTQPDPLQIIDSGPKTDKEEQRLHLHKSPEHECPICNVIYKIQNNLEDKNTLSKGKQIHVVDPEQRRQIRLEEIRKSELDRLRKRGKKPLPMRERIESGETMQIASLQSRHKPEIEKKSPPTREPIESGETMQFASLQSRHKPEIEKKSPPTREPIESGDTLQTVSLQSRPRPEINYSPQEMTSATSKQKKLNLDLEATSLKNLEKLRREEIQRTEQQIALLKKELEENRIARLESFKSEELERTELELKRLKEEITARRKKNFDSLRTEDQTRSENSLSKSELRQQRLKLKKERRLKAKKNRRMRAAERRRQRAERIQQKKKEREKRFNAKIAELDPVQTKIETPPNSNLDDSKQQLKQISEESKGNFSETTSPKRTILTVFEEEEESSIPSTSENKDENNSSKTHLLARRNVQETPSISILPENPENQFMIDDFNDVDSPNNLGNKSNVYERAPSNAKSQFKEDEVNGQRSGVLMLTFNKANEGGPFGKGGWCGYYTILKDTKNSEYFDSRNYNYLSLWIRGQTGKENFAIGLADKRWEGIGDSVKSEKVTFYLGSEDLGTDWQRVKIPLSSFSLNKSELASIAISFEAFCFPAGLGAGTVFIDDLAFVK